MSYLVRCRNAAGTAREIRVDNVRSESRAIRTALHYLERVQPNQGWRAEWAL